MAMSVQNEPFVIETVIRSLMAHPFIHVIIHSSNHSFIQSVRNSNSMPPMSQALSWMLEDRWELTRHVASLMVSP